MPKLSFEKDKIKLSNVSLSKQIATRDRAYNFFTLGMYLPNPDPVLKAQNKDITIYKELLTDSHVWSCVQSRKSKVLSMNWGLDRAKAGARIEREIQAVFDNLDMPRIIGEVLNAPLFGYQPMEVIWGKTSSAWLPQDIVSKPPDWFVFDDENRLKFRTKTNYNGDLVPDRRIITATYNATYENPYGEPLLARVFWPVTFKKGGMKFWVQFAEKYGMPFPIGKHPRSASEEDIDNLLDMLENLIQDAVAAIPDESSVDFLDFNRAGSSEVYQDLVGSMNTEISKAILSQTLTTELGQVGSYAAAEVHSGVRDDAAEWDARIVAGFFNKVIEWVGYYNYGDIEMPKFEIWEDEGIDKTQAERDKILTDSGVKFSRDYWTRTYNLEETDIEEEQEIETPPMPIIPAAGAVPGVVDPGQEEQEPEFAEAQEPSLQDDFRRDVRDAELQALAETIIEPVISILETAGDYNEAMAGIAKLYPKLETEQMQAMMRKAMLIAGAQGVVDVKGGGE